MKKNKGGKPGRPLANPELGPMVRATLALHKATLKDALALASVRKLTISVWLRQAAEEKIDRETRKA